MKKCEDGKYLHPESGSDVDWLKGRKDYKLMSGVNYGWYERV